MWMPARASRLESAQPRSPLTASAATSDTVEKPLVTPTPTRTASRTTISNGAKASVQATELSMWTREEAAALTVRSAGPTGGAQFSTPELTEGTLLTLGVAPWSVLAY